MLVALVDWLSSITHPKHWTAEQQRTATISNDEATAVHTAYAPFCRHDAYGVAGWYGPRYTLGDYFRILRRTVLLSMSLGSLLSLAMLSSSLLRTERSRAVLRKTVALHARWIMYSLGIDPLQVVVLKEEEEPQMVSPESITTTTTPILVCNHVSYLDMLVLCALPNVFPSFVAKAPIQHDPVFGNLARAMNCTFVSHGSSKRSGGSAVDEIVAKVQQQQHEPSEHRQPILIFPEGTTTNGSYLLPFRTGAFVANVPVQPILLHYNQGSTSSRFHPSWESISFRRHLWRLLAQPQHTCRMTFLSVFHPHEGEGAAQFAERVRQAMATAGNLQLSDLRYKDKAAYHAKLRELGYS